MKTCRAFGTQALVLVGAIFAQLACAAPWPNAWQIRDTSIASGSTLSYFTNLTASQNQSATNSGFRFAVNARFATDFGGAKTMTMAYGLGAKRFLIWWEVNTNGDLTAELENGPTYTLTANGTGAALYHTHEIVYNPTNGTASYVFDGVVKTNNWPASALAFTAGQVSWGASSSGGQGEMNFHSVSLDITGVGTVAAYDAGTAGSPPVAPDPTTLGWTANPSVPAQGTIAVPIAADTIGALPNAWQITDNSTANFLNYTTNLTTLQQNAATNVTGSWRYSVNARMVTNFNGAHTMTMIYWLNSNHRFLIWLDLDDDNDLRAELEGGPTYTLTTNGSGSALYHTHEIVYTNGSASYLFDGEVKTNNWPASSVGVNNAGQVYWGAGSSLGQGRMNFHSVNFTVNGLGAVAAYDAGMIGDPAAAPNPVSLGWTMTPAALPSNINTNSLSPDMALLPATTTLGADQFLQNSAQLNGWANPRGSLAMGWFEWGASLAYGNVTAPQPVGGGITPAGFSNSISGLIVGTNYYFRAVVSNSFGAVAGSSQTFNLAVFRPLVTTRAADQLTTTNARLNGQVNPHGWPTVAWFEWGTDTNYGNATSPQNLGSGSTSVAVSDVLTNLAGGPVYHFRLVATNTFGLAAGSDQSLSLSLLLTDIPGLPGVYASSVAWGDYDNDGRLDFLLTGYDGANFRSQLWRNTGVGFSNVTASVAPGLPGVSDSSVAWGDYDHDGRLDFLLTGYFYNGTVNYVSQLWRNTGVGFSNVTASVASGLPGVSDSSMAWGDYDNDGRLDFLLTGYFYNGTNNYVSQLWRNNLPLSNAPPAAPTALSATTTGTTVALNWNPAADDLTPGAGLNYNLRIGSTPGAADVLAPMAFTNGLRLLPALGNAQTGTNALLILPPGRRYYWSVQALDTSFAGSPFATEQQFTVGPLLINPLRHLDGTFEFYFTNQTALDFDVLVSTNVAQPVSGWLNLGIATPLGGNLYRFTDAGAIGQPKRFYLLRAQ